MSIDELLTQELAIVAHEVEAPPAPLAAPGDELGNGRGRGAQAAGDDVELAGQLVVDVHGRAPSTRARSAFSARLALDLTVPAEQPRASAICCSLRSS